MYSFLKVFLLVLISTLASVIAFAQTPGMIINPASGGGAAVLDPNGDGFVSQLSTGFTTNDATQSEIPYVKLAFPSTEPTSDLGPGPNCGFSDFVDQPNKDPGQAYLDANNNWLFRFRMGGISPNSKSYSILIDTDNKFGSTGPNADPNAVAGNPGFEIELVLATNFGVYVYDVNGTTSSVLKRSYLGSTNYQKSVALSANCGDPDYFLDFYVPFADITADFGITTSTPLRYAIVDNMGAQKSSIANQTSMSDLGGVDDAAYGYNFDNIFNTVINNATPTSASGGNSGYQDRSDCPTINGVSTLGTTISGTSTETTGTITVKVYQSNGTTLRSTGSVANSASWSLAISSLSPVITLALGDKVKATAQATGEGLSYDNCDIEIVTSCSSITQLINGATKISGDKGFNGSVQNPTSDSIYIYLYDNAGTLVSTTNNPAKINTTTFTVGSSTGNALANGNYYITTKNITKGYCESGPFWVCLNKSGSGNYTSYAATPTLTAPVVPATSISGAGAVAGAQIITLVNGAPATGTLSITAPNWSKTSLSTTIQGCDSIKIFQIVTNTCVSPPLNYKTPGPQAIAPVLAGTYCISAGTGLVSVTGTSSEAAGTTIYLYQSLSGTPICTTAVANGVFSGTFTATAAWIVSAKAINNSTCKSLSTASNTVTINQNISNTGLTITAPIEGATSVSGVVPASGGPFTVRLYIDGYNESTWKATSVANGAIWTISSLSDGGGTSLLGAGAKLTATVDNGSSCPSAESSQVEVACNTALINDNIDFSAISPVCSGNASEITISNTQSGIFYKVFDVGSSTYVGSNIGGNGGSASASTGSLTNPGPGDLLKTYKVKAVRLVPTTSECSVFLDGSDNNGIDRTVSVTVKTDIGPTNLTVTSSPSPAVICAGNTVAITIAASQVGVSYRLYNNATDATLSASVAGTGGSIVLTSDILTASVGIKVVATSGICARDFSQVIGVTVHSNPTAAITPSPANFCQSSAHAMNGNPTGGSGTYSTHLWSGSTSPLSATNIVNPSFNSGSTGTFNLSYTVTDNYGCVGSSNISVLVGSSPNTGVSVSAASSSVCSGTATNIIVVSESGVSYQLRDNADNSSIGSPVIGTGSNINLPTGNLTSSKTFNVLATLSGCASSQLTTTVTVTITTPPSIAVSLSAASSSVCSGTSTNIIVASESGTSYQLRNNADNSSIGSAVAGTGGNINLPTGNLTSATTFNVLATKSGCSPLQLTATANVTIATPPSLAVSVNAASSTICSGTSTNIVVASENGVSYQLRNNADNSTIGTAIAGTGGNINLPTGNLTGNKTFNVLATGASPSNCMGTLTTTSAVTVTALPTGAISATTTICVGSSTTLSINLTGSANWTVKYSDGTTAFTEPGITSSPFTKIVTPAANTTYTLTEISDANCTNSSP